MSPGRMSAGRASSANWQEPPFNRWSFCHLSEILPTARVSRGGPIRPLGHAPAIDLSAVVVEGSGRRRSVDQMLEESFVDALAVVHGEGLAVEWYGPAMSAERTHLLMSVSKSLTSVLTGTLVADGLLHPGDLVTDHVPELAGGSFEGCRVQHLLDMRAGTLFSEDYDDPNADARRYEQVSAWRPRIDPGLPDNLYSYIRGLPASRPHGGPFEYRSILTDVLGWVLEAASGVRFADLLAQQLWAPLGTEHDAEITVDQGGFALADGGICSTLRDLARVARLLLDGGMLGDRPVVPSDWIDETTTARPELVDAYRSATGVRHERVEMYHNNWWVYDTVRGVYAGHGIHGQLLYLDQQAGVGVIALSSWPRPLDTDLHHAQLALAAALVGAAAGS